MARLTELEKWPGHEKHIWSCDCSTEGHYLRITWDDDDPDWRMIMVEEVIRPRTITQRLSWAWKALRGKESWHSEVVLTDTVIQELKEFFNAK